MKVITSSNRLKHYADIVATFSVILLAGVMTWSLVTGRVALGAASTAVRKSAAASKGAEPPLPGKPIPIDPAKTLGSKTAKIGVLVFSDFECPFCGVFARDTLPTIVSDYVKTGKVQMSFRNFPLTNIHKFAQRLAEAGDCAARQGQFWPMHDRLFAAPRGQFEDSDLSKYALETGLKRDVFDDCLKTSGPSAANGDAILGRQLGVSGTPTFFFGTLSAEGIKASKRLTGTGSPGDFKAVIDSLLSSGTRP